MGVEALEDVREKIRRVDEQLLTLQQESALFVITETYGGSLGRFEASVAEHGGRSGVVIRTDLNLKPPPLLSVVAGEAIHNLRSALDHLAWTLVLNDGGSPDHRRTQFPIWEDRLTPGGELRTVTIKGGIKPETESILEDLQAFHHVNDPTQHSLALLRHLSNIDKHRTLYVTVLAVEKVSAKLFHSGELVAKSQSSGPFRDGELVAFYEHDNPLIVHEINYEFEYKPFLAFGDFRPDFHPSFPDLIGELRDFVQDRVVQRFARARFGGELDFPKPFW